MAYYLHGPGESSMFATEEEALTKMEALMQALEASGYTRKAHAIDANRFILTHPTEGFVDVSVSDEP